MKYVLNGKEPAAVSTCGISSYNHLENIAQMAVLNYNEVINEYDETERNLE